MHGGRGEDITQPITAPTAAALEGMAKLGRLGKEMGMVTVTGPCNIVIWSTI